MVSFPRVLLPRGISTLDDVTRSDQLLLIFTDEQIVVVDNAAHRLGLSTSEFILVAIQERIDNMHHVQPRIK
jgi:hypothetical protein